MVNNKNGIPIYNRQQIENLSLSFLKQFDESAIFDPDRIDPLKIIMYLKKIYDLKFDCNSDLGFSEKGKILGYTWHNRNIIGLDKFLFLGRCDDKKNDLYTFNFVLAHEIGHYQLHKNLKVKLSDTDNDINHVDDNQNSVNWKEYQANAFAAALLMPEQLFIDCFNDAKRSHFMKDIQSDADLNDIIHDLQKCFTVSYSAIKYRMKNLNLLKEIPEPKLGIYHIGNLSEAVL